MSSRDKIEFGDFQTPVSLAREVCDLLVRHGLAPDSIVEPTCGLGSFLVMAAKSFPTAKLFGSDINAGYAEKARLALDQEGASERSAVSTRDFFKHDWEIELDGLPGNLLILGNLPWVTNSTVASLNGGNVPTKQNFQGFRGIEARTGKSNFDISEWMLIRLINAVRGRAAAIAILCKTSTARKLLRFAWQNDGRITTASLFRIDAKQHFGASVDACLLFIRTGTPGLHEAPVYASLQGRTPEKIFGLGGRDMVSNLRDYETLRHLEGLCPFQWRSGIKHDCSSVMELWLENNRLRNKLGESIELEPDFLFPLLKCSDLANGRTHPERYVLVTQKRVGEDTAKILPEAPRTWQYLDSHRKLFEARKSSIYANQHPFALFGIGDYSFAPWKVAISGLHKNPRFLPVGSFQDRPTMLDDTCYFLPFQSEQEANIIADILNSEPCLRFILSLLFEDSKRPITVELLQRLNLRAIAEEAGLADQWDSVRSSPELRSSEPIAYQAELLMERPVRR